MFVDLTTDTINDKVNELANKYRVEDEKIKEAYTKYSVKIYKNVAHSNLSVNKNFSWITNYTLRCLEKYYQRNNNEKQTSHN